MGRERIEKGSVRVMALGFFAIVAQTLLFRDFLAAFEGNELSIGVFFGSWLLWVSVGAIVGRAAAGRSPALVSRFALVALLYIPAFVVQHQFLLNARSIAGIESYVLFPFFTILGLSFVLNVFVSVLTGFLFTLASVWSERYSSLPVSRVYILEAMGAALGGFFVTLQIGWSSSTTETIFLWSAVFAGMFFVCPDARISREQRARWTAGSAVAIFLTAFVLESLVIGYWSEWNDHRAWSHLLPADSYQGSFKTAQGRYLFGRRDNQHIVMTEGAVCETLPPSDHDAEVAAVNLVQSPKAQSVLVFGSRSLGACIKLAKLPQMKQVSWTHPDPEYPASLEQALKKDSEPDMLEFSDVDMPDIDIRALARKGGCAYDLVILNLPDLTTLSINRYGTADFFASLKRILNPGGVVSVRISGGENYLGSELSLLGASMQRTLESCFKNTAMKPGEETWLFASDGDDLSMLSNVLRDRFKKVEGSRSLYPEEMIPSLYPPDRIHFQSKIYQDLIENAPLRVPLNTDEHPAALTFGLLVAMKQAGWKFPVMGLAGLQFLLKAVLLCPFLVYWLLRVVFRVRSRGAGGATGATDALFLVFAAGFVSMASGVALMFMYQSRFGTLFREIGAVTAIFMTGSSLGGFCVDRGLKRLGLPKNEALLARSRLLPDRTGQILSVMVVCHFCLLCALPFAPMVASWWLWLGMFLLAGICTGAYFPIAAFRLKEAGRATPAAASSLEAIDHLAGAVGAIVTGLLLLPLLGISVTCLVLILVVAVAASLAVVPARTVARGDWFDRSARPVAYILVGVAITMLILSHAATWSLRPSKDAVDISKTLLDAAGHMLPGTQPKIVSPAASGQPGLPEYAVVQDTSGTSEAYVLLCDPWNPGLFGYAGPISLAACINKDGTLRDYYIVKSNETPSYLYMVTAKKKSLVGRNVFQPAPFKGVDGVSGATISDWAIRTMLEQAGRGFAADILKMAGTKEQPPEETPWNAFLKSPGKRDFILLSLFVGIAILMRFFPGTWRRRVLLFASLVSCGFLLNLQYSLHSVLSLVGLQLKGVGITGTSALLLALPVAALFFGNVYCGYVCPFGALQELLSELCPERARIVPRKRIWRYTRCVKYVLLFLTIVWFALTGDMASLAGDPLVTVFSGSAGRLVWILVAVVLLLSIYFRRFWCRNLCPAGAFLSIFSGLGWTKWTKSLHPVRHPVSCDLGVRAATDLDCIYCDRCNFARNSSKASHSAPFYRKETTELVLVLAVLMVAAFVGFMVLTESPSAEAVEALQPALPPSAASAPPPRPEVAPAVKGTPRDLDSERVRRLIHQGTLSDHPAEYSKPLTEESPSPPASVSP